MYICLEVWIVPLVGVDLYKTNKHKGNLCMYAGAYFKNCNVRVKGALQLLSKRHM